MLMIAEPQKNTQQILDEYVESENRARSVPIPISMRGQFNTRALLIPKGTKMGVKGLFAALAKEGL